MAPPSNDPKSKKPARRRKKKSRTEVSETESSSSSDSSSSSSSSEDEGMKDADVVAEDADVSMLGVISDEDEGSSGEEDIKGGKKGKKLGDIEGLEGNQFLDKLWGGDWKDLDSFPEEIPRRFPEGIEKLRDPNVDERLVAAKFEEYYMKCVTTEFGEDLDRLRGAKDFDDDSIPMLLRLLKRGVNIFDDEEKNKVVVDERQRWEEEERKRNAKEELERESAMELGRARS